MKPNSNGPRETVIETSGRRKALHLPDSITPADLQVARNDCELLAAALAEHPQLWQPLNDAIARGDIAGATKLVEEAGLSELDVKVKGGGFIWLIVIVILLYATDAY